MSKQWHVNSKGNCSHFTLSSLLTPCAVLLANENQPMVSNQYCREVMKIRLSPYHVSTILPGLGLLSSECSLTFGPPGGPLTPPAAIEAKETSTAAEVPGEPLSSPSVLLLSSIPFFFFFLSSDCNALSLFAFPLAIRVAQLCAFGWVLLHAHALKQRCLTNEKGIYNQNYMYDCEVFNVYRALTYV